MPKPKSEKVKGTQYTCGSCGKKFTKDVEAGEGVVCPGCGSSDHLSSECDDKGVE